jgi:hypothetical protein
LNREPVSLSHIDFGALAAERDSALRTYFVESASFFRLRDGERRVVLGNRGSGKSAIFKMIADQARSNKSLVIELTPEDYSYELLKQTVVRENEGAWAKQGAYAAAWKYLIYVLIMKRLTTDSPVLKTGSYSKIYAYLRDNHANFGKNPVGVLISYLKRLEGIKLGSYEAGIKAKELQKLYRLEEINNLMQDIDSIAAKRNAIVLIDELDRGWDASEDAVAFVAGLFQAAVSISQHTPNVRVLVSLRKELYNNIPALYEDAQKVRDIIEEIEWDENQLKTLVARRIAASAGISDESMDRAWNSVFAETLDYRKTQSFNYLVDRTLYRPREIIQFCTDIQNVAKRMNATPPINYDVISAAEYSYSEARLKDIAAEYRFQYPALLSVFETFRGGPYNFMSEALEFHCLSITVGDTKIAPDAFQWASTIDHSELIGILWRIGFLRAQAVGGLRARQRSGSRYLGSHQVSSLNLQTIKRFHIHPMFRASLGLKEKTAE